MGTNRILFFSFLGWGEIESTWYVGHYWPIVPADQLLLTTYKKLKKEVVPIFINPKLFCCDIPNAFLVRFCRSI
jgi:hypothetical protein